MSKNTSSSLFSNFTLDTSTRTDCSSFTPQQKHTPSEKSYHPIIIREQVQVSSSPPHEESSPPQLHSFQFLITHTQGFEQIVKSEIQAVFHEGVEKDWWYHGFEPSVNLFDYPTTAMARLLKTKNSKLQKGKLKTLTCVHGKIHSEEGFEMTMDVNFAELFHMPEFLFSHNELLIFNLVGKSEYSREQFMEHISQFVLHLNALPSVDCVYSFISLVPNIPLDKESAFSKFKNEIPYRTQDEMAWKQSFELFQKLYTKKFPTQEVLFSENTKFRVTAIRKQSHQVRHSYSSVEIASEYGYGIGQHICKNMRVNLKKFDIDILIYLDTDRAVTALLLSPPFHYLHEYGLRHFSDDTRSSDGGGESDSVENCTNHSQSASLQNFPELDLIYYYTKQDFRLSYGKSTLKPQTSYLLWKTLLMQDASLCEKAFSSKHPSICNVLDPFAGSGTLSLSANYFFFNKSPKIQLFNLDCSSDETNVMNHNCKHHTNIHILLSDSQSIPFKSQSIDVVLSDMPFGVLCGSHSRNAKIYPKVVKQLERIIKPDGILFLLTIEKTLLEAQLAARNFWEIIDRKSVSLGELGRAMQATIYICKKKSK
ncbi:hypothetical protein FDP41_000983 [Naegleria fowleri]|uniref:Ribosomal RNA large subunit methyltransferase K/L-like methyltransferase domain-containing protein n=1 Tax=Naegleria fowleri TaxID=5763 RepID=A0A6A5C1V1_NAEFO|nr:uncharacterized protein FDP41_000983 [Naegleria fowleri]KAF0979830.1 hypothetical protein FDP41_000983 [Naegleria fowleri]CAG4708446.1 unnamed protein product [Naegleria fowleri]